MEVDKFVDNLLICNFSDLAKNEKCNAKDDITNRISILWECDWLKLINNPFVIEYFENNLNGLIDDSEYNILITAEAFLLAFVQENFIGPNLSEEYKSFIDTYWPKRVNAVEQLKVDAEELNSNVRYPEFLLTAKLLLQQVDKNHSKAIFDWWKIRFIFIHQNVLEELSSSLYAEFCTLVDSVTSNADQINDIELEILLLIEIAQVYITFHYVHEAERILDKIFQKSGIQLNVEGLLGYRTKFQQKPLPQLCLKTNQNLHHFLSSAETSSSTQLPKLLKLDDAVRLEKINFKAAEDNQVPNVPSLIQTLILVQTRLLLKSQPKDRLNDEIIEPYLTGLLHQEHGPLGVRLAALLLNLKQEANHKRTVERSFKQCEKLLKIIMDTKFSVKERLSYGFVSLTPIWEIQKQLGDLMSSLGLIKSALNLYIEIHAWEKVIECYTLLEMRHKAAEVIRDELEKKETVKLYCLLGDATDDPNCYEIAWKLSKETSGRAQRHWGSYYFAKKQYEDALPHLEKSLEINSLQEIIWLRLGYAALMLEKWEIAARAYLRYTHIEPNGFESWNNLAKAVIKLGDKKRAHKILSEALKCNFNNWKVWENFMIVSLDTGHFEDVINSYNRLIELKEKEKFIDMEILELLVNAVVKNLPDAQSRPAERLRKKLNQLVAHQCVAHANEPKLWEFAACLAETSLSKAQKLQKSYQAFTQKESSWSRKLDTCLKVMSLCKDLCQYSLLAVDNYDESEKSIVMSQLSSARLTVQGCIRAIENNNEKWSETNLLLQELKMYLEKTTEEIKKRL